MKCLYCLSGMILIPAAVIGQVGGGYVIKKFDMQIKAQIKLCIVITLLLLVTNSGFWMKCKQNNIAGVNYGYNE